MPAKRTPAQRSKAAVTTAYVVLYRIPGQADAGWQELGDPEDANEKFIVKSRGREQAIRDALRLHTTLKSMTETETGIHIWPVPVRSYEPLPVRLVPREPELKIG